ncbi:hypothetical protein Q7P36_005495 [Cladosporium allicinum]
MANSITLYRVDRNIMRPSGVEIVLTPARYRRIDSSVSLGLIVASSGTNGSRHFPRLPASYKRGLFSVYQDSTELFQHEQDYENWSSGQPPQLDFSEFLTQDFSHHNDLPGCEYSVSGANFDIDFEALLASTTPSNSNSQTATTTTDSSATLTPVDLSTRQDNAPFDPLNTTSTILFDPSQTQSSHASTGFSLSTGAVNSMRVDIPSNSSFTATTFPSQQSSQQRPTPPPSVSTAERGASKSTSPAAVDKTGTVSPSDSHGDDVGPESRKRKRERNTEAARRYRQRRQDRLEELEEALAAMTKDRDDLRIKLARSEAETDILRGLMAKK